MSMNAEIKALPKMTSFSSFAMAILPSSYLHPTYLAEERNLPASLQSDSFMKNLKTWFVVASFHAPFMCTGLTMARE
ncbi:uncharacterized protein M421DRAFT_424905 [Didymella exigua CBS 183.55]|uniref:Uncharacterized protein n=1 Tax=Didymella exigua CBS 183.55 TaxID=1150837 RepID=A0A6A5R7W7_9PLEO|nr:uncharacterized protein M421DRAFT_424905 [Didymella exigua CBS 183.55]KAF1924265.1 hypothetical protein M421DRAFT_424905 [Didymella exigua CBS 183.55]